jgi:hypothetical protein
MMQKSTTFTTIFPVKKCYFHYDMQKISWFTYLSTYNVGNSTKVPHNQQQLRLSDK